MNKILTMNNTEVTGEQSCNGRENGDAPTGSERPLKKARFAWQVKGKYRLKNENNESNKNHTLPSNISSELSSTSPSSISVGSQVEDYLMNQDYSLLDSVINPDNSLLTPNTTITREHRQYPRYVSSYERNFNHLPGCLPRVEYSEDKCIANWQTVQLLKCDLENSLNEVMEAWLNNTIHEEFNQVVEFMNHVSDANSVENEGILMAISAHGLQNAPISNNDPRNMDDCNTSRLPVFNFPTSLDCLSSSSDEDNHQHDDIERKSTDNLQSWQKSNENADSSDVSTPITYFSDPSHSPENSNIDKDWQTELNFMNTAILNAINTKGLTVLGTKYG